MREVKIVIPCWNNAGLLKHAVNKIKAMTDDVDYEILIVDNQSNQDTKDAIRTLVIEEHGWDRITWVTRPGEATRWGSSAHHGEGLNFAKDFLYEPWTFIMHDDSVPLDPSWLKHMLDSCGDDKVACAISTNWEVDDVRYLHCSGLLMKSSFILDNDIDFRPNKPHYDTAGQVTQKLLELGLNYHVLQNSHNNPELKEHHLYQHRGEEAFNDSGKPIFAHQGRGSSQKDRGGFIR